MESRTEMTTSVKMSVDSNWGSGFVGTITIRNEGTEPVNGWTLDFQFPHSIDGLWNGTILSNANGGYSIRDAGWNASIPPGGSVSFGFYGTPNGTIEPSPTWTVNGQEATWADALPWLSVADTSLVEGNDGSRDALVTLRLSKPATEAVSVDLATSGYTAWAGSDFQGVAQTVSFAAGEQEKLVRIPVNGDLSVEPDEFFNVNLSNARGIRVMDGVAKVTIVNDDAMVAPTIQVSDVTVTEGGPGGQTLASFTVSLSNAYDKVVSVNYATADGSATVADGDYAATSGTLSFAAGETTKTITVVVNGDSQVEADEAFRLLLSQAVNGTIADGEGTGTIISDDAPPKISVADVTLPEGNGTGTALVEVRLSGATDRPVTVDYATSVGTALPGQDYTQISGTLTFAPGETSKLVPIIILGDSQFEEQEYFFLNLSQPTNATIEDGQGVIRLDNDDAQPLGLSIADLTMPEGDGPGVARVTVSLTAATDHPVTVNYASSNSSATEGSDYTAVTGTLTFAAGETSKVIEVPILGDMVGEGAESFNIDLSGASGAEILKATGKVTLNNDDLPTISVSIAHATVTESDPGATVGGFLHTVGNQFVDESGATVRLNGVNWGGMQETINTPFGIWTRPWKDIMNQMKELGFNTIRLPFSTDTLADGAQAQPHAWLNPDWAGKTPLEIMDAIVDYAGEIGMRIILDRHRGEAGGPADTNGNGLWYYGEYTEERWISDWVKLAQRYADNPTVIGADLYNEPYGYAPHQPDLGLAGWGNGGPTDWRLAAERAGNAILQANPDWLIFVEGNSTYNDNWYIWGGNLMGADQYPVRLDDPSKLVYSPHVYFRDPSYYLPNTQYQDFQKYWGYLFEQNRAPIMVGEFGSRLTNEEQVEWMKALVRYMNGDFNGDGVSDLAPGQQGVSFTFWDFSPSSADTGGILTDDWQSVNWNKMNIIKEGMIDLPRADGKTMLTFAISLSQKVSDLEHPVTIGYHTVDGTATEGSDYVGTSGTLTFKWGEMSKLVQVEVLSDTVLEGKESVILEITDANGAIIGTARAVGYIADNDGGSAAAAAAPADLADPADGAETPAALDALYAEAGVEDVAPLLGHLTRISDGLLMVA